MAKILTDWLTIATAGATVDGREILPEWLEQMAANYDRREYAALLWDSHEHLSTFGAVDQLQVITDDQGRLALQAQIEPLADLMWVANYRVLFFSIEVDDNFQGKGSAYLGGVALTSEPASVATSQLKFSKNSEKPRVFSRALAVTAGAIAKPLNTFQQTSSQQTTPEVFQMDEELKTALEQIQASLTELHSKVDALQSAQEEAVEVIEEVAEEVVGEVDTEASKKHNRRVRKGGSFARVQADLAKVEAALGKLPAGDKFRQQPGASTKPHVRF